MQTNPNQPPTDPTNVMGRRIGAWLIDAAIAIGVFVVLSLAILTKLDLPNSAAASSLCDIVNDSPGNNICINFGSTVYGGDGSDIATIWLSLVAFFFIFHVGLPSITGYSPGKGMIGLRVVKQQTFQTAGFGANLVRWLLWLVDSLPGVPLVGLITGFASKGHRRVGDMVASTLVVDKRSVGVPIAVAGLNIAGTGPTGAAPPPPTEWALPPSATPPLVPSPPDSVSAWAPPTSPTSPAPPVSPPLVATPPAPAPIEEPVAEYAPVVEPAPVEGPATEQSSVPEESAGDDSAGVDGPQWDAARNTYIQWDPELQEWMEWDERQERWIPISR